MKCKINTLLIPMNLLFCFVMRLKLKWQNQFEEALRSNVLDHLA